MQVKMKECRFCGTGFKPSKTTQKACSIRCAIALSKEIQVRKENREWQREKKIRKERLKTHADWLKDLQKVFNAFIRKRDEISNCISCGRPLTGRKFDAGHYRSVGSAPHLRFNEKNVWGQCVPCNRNLHGNLIEYRKGLVERIGEAAVEKLEQENVSGKMTIPEIQDKIKLYKAKLK